MKKTALSKKILAVILAGGKGSRLWPLSETETPKQFLGITGRESLLDQTIRRNLALVSPENIYIVGVRKYAKQKRVSLDKFKIPLRNLLLEPEGRNTGPALLAAVIKLHKRNSGSYLLVSASDQIISLRKKYIADVKTALSAAADGYLVLFGVKPAYAETEYGYIKVSSRIGKYYKASGFIEKPDAKKAGQLIKQGTWLWNSGMFMVKASVILEEFKKKLPLHYQKLIRSRNASSLRKIYKKLKPVSMEQAVVQRFKKLALVKAGFKWQDLGQWNLIYDFLKKDKNKNVFKGNVFALDTKNCFILSQRSKLLLLGLKDMVVVDTGSGLLVSSRQCLPKLKTLLKKI